MPRSSFSDNPLLRVSRPVSACSRCRSAKVKCDGKLPACTACEKAGRENECSAANDQFARGKERSYVAALELRIEKLERRLAYARSRKASVANHESEQPPGPADISRKDSLATIRAAIHRNAARKRENSDVNSLVSDFGFLSVNATTRDFELSTSNMTFARLVLAASTNDEVPPSKNAKLPSRQAAQAIVQYYMATIYSLFPAFPESAIFTALDDLYQQDQRPIKDSDYWLLFMVLAIGSTAQSRNHQDDFYHNGVEFVARALPFADKALMPGFVTQIQSLLLLTQYAMLDPVHYDSWHLIGFTCRAVIDLGYHQDPPPEQLSEKELLDIRRRTFYCVYSIDRAISMVHARAFSFTDDSVNVAFPSMNGMSRIPSISGTITGPQSADPAILIFQLRRAQSHWYQALFQSDPNKPFPTTSPASTPRPFGDPGSPHDAIENASQSIWQWCHDMREWAEALPDTLPPGIRDLFDIDLRYSYVYCIAPSARAPHMTDYGRLLIFEHAIAYMHKIDEIAHAPVNATFVTYHDALRVYFMGSQFVAVLRDAEHILLEGRQVLMPLVKPGKAPPPPLPEKVDVDGQSGMPDNLVRSIRCLEQVSKTLKKYGNRWGDALSLMRSFDMQSAEWLERLRARKDMRDAAMVQQQQQQQQQRQQQRQQQQQMQHHGHHHQLSGGGVFSQPQYPPSHMQPVQQMGQVPLQFQQMQPQQVSPPPGQPAQQEVRWVEMDVAQMMRNGGV